MTSLTNSYAADGLVAPLFFTRPPYHPFNPEERGLVEAPVTVLALPLPKGRLGKLGPYPRGANGWRQWDPTCPFSDKFALMLHLFTFAMELNDNNGTPVFLGAPGSAKVRRSQLAFLRRIEGRSRKGDEHLLKVGTDIKWDSTCDKRLSEVFHAINTGVYDNRIPGRVDRARDNGDDFADGVRYEVPEEDDGGGGGGWGRQRRGRGRGNRRRRNGEDEDDDDENDEDESENDDDQEDIAIMSILNETLKDARGNSCEGKEIIEKVKIIVQNMRRPCADAGNQPNRDEDAGCVVFFCVMDELFSMGTPFHTLVKMGEEHRLFVSRQRKSQPVKRGQGGRPQVSEPGLIERFPFLKVCSPTLFLLSANEEMKDPDHIANGLLNFKAETYLDLAAFITNDPRMVRENREANLHSMNRMSNPGNAWNPNPMHPALLFTVEWALQTMRLYGVPRSQASMEVLKGSANWLAEQERLMIMSQFVDRWYFDPERSYHYLMAGFVWARLGSAGLESQYFPWFNVPAPLLKTSVSRSTSNALVRYEHGRGANELAPDYAEAMIIPDLGRPEVLPSKFFDPNVISRRSGIRQVTLENARLMATLQAPADPPNEPKAYALYCSMLAEHREACMTHMANVLKPSNHIYPSMNAILTWMATDMRRVSRPLKHITTDPYDVNPSTWPLDGFANYMIHMGLALKNDLFLAARADRWILAHHAAHDCHSSIDVKMHPSAIVHGPPEGGKSHLFNSALDNTAIPDTVTPVLESSEKAYYVHDDTMGVIMRVDEAPKIWVDGKAADADKSGTAERIKSMTTEHKATYRTLVLIEGANGRTERRAETIESLFHATMWICTNKMVSHGDEAIASRFFNFIMTRSECDLFEFASLKEHLNDDDRNRKADSIHAWRVKQALLAISLVLIDSQILPRPSMDVFDHIHTRVLAYFKEQGVNTNAIRKATLPQFSLEFSIFNPMDEKVDMVNRVAVIYTVLNGLICLYDNPGAKYFGKEFELSQLMDLVPYLYCTKQIAIFTMTQTEEVFLNPLRSAVLRAVMVMAKLPYVRGKTIEQYFKEDVTRSLGRTWRQEDHGDRGRFYDFNYVAVGGADFKDIYSNIAECCDIKVGANEVQSVLEGLSGNASGYIRVNRVQPIREDFYTNLTSPGILNYTGLTREPNLSPLQIVVRDFKNKILFVATEAINKLHDDLLMDAFQACMYSTWQPQELLLAYEVRKQDPVHLDRDVTYVGLFDVLRVTPELVAEYSFVESYSAPNVAYVTPTTASILSGPRLHADKVGESYATNREKRSKTTMSIKEDLDVWGHKQHHYRAGHPGKPQDSPSYPNTVRESVRRALQLNEDRHRANELPGQDAASMHTGLMPKCLKICYPLTIIDELDDELIDKSSARPFTAIATATQQAYNLSLAEWKRTKVGPMPVLQTMGGAGRLARSNFALAEVANKGAAQTDGRRRAGPHSRNRTKWVDYKRQTLGGLQPEPLIAEMPINMEAWHARKQLILAKRRQIAMGNATAALPLTEGGGGGAHIDVDATTATITTTGYDELAYLSNLLPSDFDMTALPAPIESLPPPSAQQQQQQTRPQPQTVMSTSYTMQGDMVVLTKGIRPKAGPLTSSSTSASSASTSSKGLKKAPPLRRTASEAFDEEARAILMRSISMGFGDSGGGGAGSSLSSHSTGSRDSAGEGYDAEDSRHLIKKKQPRVVLDEDPDGVPPPPSLLDDEGDNALEPMDMDQVEQEDDDDDDEDNNEIDLEDYEVEQEDE